MNLFSKLISYKWKQESHNFRVYLLFILTVPITRDMHFIYHKELTSLGNSGLSIYELTEVSPV